ARMELGAGGRGERNAECRQIMDELIGPRFKKGEFSSGILEGVKGLHALVLGLPIPRRPWYQRPFRLKSMLVWLLPLVFLAAITRDAIDRQQTPGCVGFGLAWWAAFFAFWLTRSGS